jgi:hypothetical protein
VLQLQRPVERRLLGCWLLLHALAAAVNVLAIVVRIGVLAKPVVSVDLAALVLGFRGSRQAGSFSY